MDNAIIFDVDGTLSETEETHRRAFNRAFREAGLDWHWDTALYTELLAVTGGKERIRYFMESRHVDAPAPDARDAFVRALHADKTRTYTAMLAGGDVELRPGIYTHGQDFDEAAMVIDDLAAFDFRRIYALTRLGR